MAKECATDILTQAAEDARNRALGLNIYKKEAGTNYGSTHPNALANENGSDDPTNIKGKGTGVLLDTFNGGGTEDINGALNQPGSGRIANLLTNKFSPQNTYKTPELDGTAGIGSL